MTSELSDLIWGRLGLAAVRAVPLEEPRAPSAEAGVTELRLRGAAWTRELRLRPLPGQQVFTIDAMRLLVDPPTPAAAGSTSARGASEGLVAAPPRHPVLSRDSRAHSESAAARAREEPAALQGQGLRRARAPHVLRGPRGLQHARPDGPHSAAAAGAPDRRGFFLLRRRRALRLRAARGAEAEAHAPQAGQRQVPRSPRHAGRPSQAGRPLPHLETPNSARQHDPAGGAGAQGRHSLQGVPRVLRDRREEAPPVSRAPREELGEDSDNEGSESEAEGSGSEPERPMAKAAPKPKAKAKAAPRPLSGWCALEGDYSHLCLRVLCKSGKKCLQMSWGPLRFVDSMNVFPTSLASMIDDLRACTHKQLPELFPLMASLHPELQLRTPTDSPPQRRPLKQRRTHCDLEQAWDCILRKLPMPFEHFCGAEAWEMPAVWEQHCYDSVLAGKAVSAEDHRLAVNTANVMGWETFREFHDCYLHTDVLALADVMESYRDSFRAQSGLDPIHYVTLPGAAWDAMLRHSARETPIHLITDEQAYRDVRASVMGGLSCIFQPFAQSNNPELGEEDYNPEEPVSWISYLDFNAMYPAAMTLPMPNGPCVAIALPEDNAARLSWLRSRC